MGLLQAVMTAVVAELLLWPSSLCCNRFRRHTHHTPRGATPKHFNSCQQCCVTALGNAQSLVHIAQPDNIHHHQYNHSTHTPRRQLHQFLPAGLRSV